MAILLSHALMFYPLSLSIGLRYTRAKRKNHFISFIAATSMLGIALGVAVLITVLAVMTGFDEEIRERFFAVAPEINVNAHPGSFDDWPRVAEQVLQTPEVLGVAPTVVGQGLMTFYSGVEPVFISGILPEEERQVTQLEDKVIIGALDDLQAGGFNVVVGQQLAQELGLLVGDKVTVMIPTASVTPVGLIPRFKRFTVVGIFSVNAGFGLDARVIYLHLSDAQRLLQLQNAITGLRVRIDTIYAAPRVAETIAIQLPEQFYVSNWTQDYGAFFQTIQLEKTMMFLILLLIIAVAAFNLVSSLMMAVTDKRADIAILRTMGMGSGTVMRVFIVQGLIIGSLGTLLGLLGGLLLAWNVTEIVNFLQHLLGKQILAESVYFVDYLPSKILWMDVLKVCFLALGLSFLATLYPSWRAAKVQPAEALRYE